MIHPHTRLEWINDKKGFGVIATRPIPLGTITWVQDELDAIYPPYFLDKLKPLSRTMLDKYSFRNNRGEFILCWDIAKYVNHSFSSNCLSTAYNFEVAIRDIEDGEELTDDYGYLNLTESFVPEDEGLERKSVEPDDILKYHPNWDRKLKKVFPFIPQVDQPLFDLLPDKVKIDIIEVARGNKKMPSTKILHYYPEKMEFKD